jgi:hypothetical protein
MARTVQGLISAVRLDVAGYEDVLDEAVTDILDVQQADGSWAFAYYCGTQINYMVGLRLVGIGVVVGKGVGVAGGRDVFVGTEVGIGVLVEVAGGMDV